MRLMVACKTLTWVEVDTDTGKVGPARVADLPENVDVPEAHEVVGVMAVDPDEDGSILIADAFKAIRLVQDSSSYTFRLEEGR